MLKIINFLKFKKCFYLMLCKYVALISECLYADDLLKVATMYRVLSWAQSWFKNVKHVDIRQDYCYENDCVLRLKYVLTRRPFWMYSHPMTFASWLTLSARTAAVEILSEFFRQQIPVNITGTLSSSDTTIYYWMLGVESMLTLSYKVTAAHCFLCACLKTTIP